MILLLTTMASADSDGDHKVSHELADDTDVDSNDICCWWLRECHMLTSYCILIRHWNFLKEITARLFIGELQLFLLLMSRGHLLSITLLLL